MLNFIDVKMVNPNKKTIAKKKPTANRTIANSRTSFSRQRLRRTVQQTNRYGQRVGSTDHDDFFNQFTSAENSSQSDLGSERGEMAHTAAVTDDTLNQSTSVTIDNNDSIASIATSGISIMSSELSKTAEPNSFEHKVLKLLKEILARSIQTEKHVARIDARNAAANHGFVENHLVERQTDYVCQQMDTSDQIELIKFGLPISSLMGMKKVENDLRNEDIFAQVQRVLQKIGGINGKAKGVKVLEPLVHAIIEPKMLANISWTGRGKGNEKKIPMSANVNIVRLITSLCEKADSSYLPKQCKHDIVYKILKHAVSKYGNKEDESDCLVS